MQAMADSADQHLEYIIVSFIFEMRLKISQVDKQPIKTLSQLREEERIRLYKFPYIFTFLEL